jgi:hypothetical protein
MNAARISESGELFRPCPFCGGRNTGYWIVGIEEVEWFTTVVQTNDGFTLDACSAADRHRCPNLRGKG